MENKRKISVKNLRLKFPGEDSLVFRDLSFAASQGEKVLLLGPSGCGKSTLLQVLCGILPHSIEVPLKYESIMVPDSWGFVFQDPDTQFCMPFVDEELAFVLENLQVPREEMEPLIKTALDRTGLGSLELHTPIETLSQGMKQRLALASVLLLEPDVLFLDEPSALLDPEGTEQIWKSVKDVTHKKTVIIVEHKIERIADWVDRVVLFNHDGDVIADGEPDTIFSKHRQELIEYGIWYPGVWDDYIHSPRYLELGSSTAPEQLKTVVRLEDFSGFRGKSEKIRVPHVEIDAGEWITIIGDNGAGKSTFLLSLMQLLRTEGLYELNGKPLIWRKKKKRLPEGLALVFQNPELQFIANSVYEELAVSLRLTGLNEAETDRKVRDLLTLFGLPVSGQRHPYQLSTGQKRRLSVATAFARESDVLLLDEPTFGQDAQNTFLMLEKLEELRRNGTAIVMVTHDMQIVEHFATEIWTIEDGKLALVKKQAGKERDDAGRLVYT